MTHPGVSQVFKCSGDGVIVFKSTEVTFWAVVLYSGVTDVAVISRVTNDVELEVRFSCFILLMVVKVKSVTAMLYKSKKIINKLNYYLNVIY